MSNINKLDAQQNKNDWSTVLDIKLTISNGATVYANGLNMVPVIVRVKTNNPIAPSINLADCITLIDYDNLDTKFFRITGPAPTISMQGSFTGWAFCENTNDFVTSGPLPNISVQTSEVNNEYSSTLYVLYKGGVSSMRIGASVTVKTPGPNGAGYTDGTTYYSWARGDFNEEADIRAIAPITFSENTLRASLSTELTGANLTSPERKTSNLGVKDYWRQMNMTIESATTNPIVGVIVNGTNNNSDKLKDYNFFSKNHYGYTLDAYICPMSWDSHSLRSTPSIHDLSIPNVTFWKFPLTLLPPISNNAVNILMLFTYDPHESERVSSKTMPLTIFDAFGNNKKFYLNCNHMNTMSIDNTMYSSSFQKFYYSEGNSNIVSLWLSDNPPQELKVDEKELYIVGKGRQYDQIKPSSNIINKNYNAYVGTDKNNTNLYAIPATKTSYSAVSNMTGYTWVISSASTTPTQTGRVYLKATGNQFYCYNQQDHYDNQREGWLDVSQNKWDIYTLIPIWDDARFYIRCSNQWNVKLSINEHDGRLAMEEATDDQIKNGFNGSYHGGESNTEGDLRWRVMNCFDTTLPNPYEGHN